MKYLVLGRGEGARNLASALGCKAMLPPNNKRARRALFKEHDLVINMGWSTGWAHLNPLGYKNVWKKDKVKASTVMEEWGVSVIPYYHPNYVSRMLEKFSFPILRRKAKHSKGRDIKIVDSITEVTYGYWYVPIFDKKREYRAHVMFGEVIKLFRKHPEDKTKLVWCNDSSRFERVNPENSSYNKIKEQAIKAVEALGLDFGAVDIGVRKFKREGEEVVVFEVNTAPSLNESTAECYGEVIRRKYA